MDEETLRANVRAANRNWLASVQKQTFEMDYDAGADVLYASFGPPQEAFSMDADSNGSVLLRIKLDTYEIVGFDIISLKENFLKSSREAEMAFRPILESFGDGDWFVTISPASKDTQAIFRLFIPKLISEMAGDLVAA
ncbi:MAG: hypothetical protein FJ039_09865 [Chloroflexi bacterium]|nr:hypothetical protein [Chloroflexota bacterium]